MINTNNIDKAKNLIRQEKKPIIVKAQSSFFNRKILEHGHVDILLSPEINTEKNTLKTINSGLNNFLARLANKNNIVIGFDLSILKSLEKKEKAELLAKYIQNIKICRKAKAKLILANYKDKINAQCFLISLGSSTYQAKQALAF